MLTFDEASHTYHLNGKRVPSVTQVLAQLTDLSHIPADILERKRQIGTAVHKAIELDCRGELDESTIHPLCRPYFDGWLLFKSQSGFVIESSEERVASELYQYAGTLDLCGELPVGPAIIDAKCTNFLYPTVGPQLAAYKEAKGKAYKKHDRYALQLTPEGKYLLEPLKDKSDWATFHAALTLTHWRQKNV